MKNGYISKFKSILDSNFIIVRLTNILGEYSGNSFNIVNCDWKIYNGQKIKSYNSIKWKKSSDENSYSNDESFVKISKTRFYSIIDDSEKEHGSLTDYQFKELGLNFPDIEE